MTRYRSGYSHGSSVERMYRKLRKYGAQALNRREPKLLRRESDIGMNPRGHRGHRRKSRKWTTAGFSGRKRRNPRFVAPQSLRGSALRYNWERQMARRAERDAVTARYQRPTRVYIPDKEDRYQRNPHRDGRPTKGEQRRARRTGRYDFEPDYGPFYGPVYGRRRGRSRRNPQGHRGHRRKHRDFNTRYARWEDHWIRPSLYPKKRLRHLRGQRNPKRDGTPTRGELRKVKKSTYLKTIMQRGKDAEAILARIHAVPAASKAAIQELAPAVAVMEAPTPAVVAQVEHAEAKFLRSRIDELGVLHADLLSQIAELGDDDLSADDASMMQEQAVKIAKQRGLLRAKAKSLGIQTNPGPNGRNPGPGHRRGGSGRGHGRGSHGRRVLVGLRAYGVALKRLHQAIRAR